MQQLNQDLLYQVLDIARQAGTYLKQFYTRSVDIHIKDDQTPVTEADLFVSQFVIDRLQKLTPHIPVLSEEGKKRPLAERQQWQEYWIIDPLDGTQQFIDHTDQFSVVIGFVQHNRPVLGVIHAPILDKTYFAMQGSGAFLQENGKIRPLVPQNKSCQENYRLSVAIGASCRNKIQQSICSPYHIDFITYGSCSLKAGLVAEGKADCYIRLGATGEWDTAVPEVILNEIGGGIMGVDFLPLSYNQRETLINPPFIMVGTKIRQWQAIFQLD